MADHACPSDECPGCKLAEKLAALRETYAEREAEGKPLSVTVTLNLTLDGTVALNYETAVEILRSKGVPDELIAQDLLFRGVAATCGEARTKALAAALKAGLERCIDAMERSGPRTDARMRQCN